MSLLGIYPAVQPITPRIFEALPEDNDDDTPTLRDSLDDRAAHYGWQDGRAGRPSRREVVSVFLVCYYDRGYREGARSRAGVSLAAADEDYRSRSALIGMDF